MKLYVVAVRDRAADCFARPFFVPAIGQAIRSFQDEVNRSAEDNPIFGHSEDFDLYLLGSFDDNTGGFESSAAKQIAVGKDLKRQP